MRIYTFILVFLIATPAFAQDAYWGAYVGVSIAEDSNLTVSGTTGTLAYDPGAAIGGAIGKSFGALRGEVELTSRADAVTGLSAAGRPLSGNVLVTALMGNLMYDISVSEKFVPHLGGGLGLTGVTIDYLNDGVNYFADDSSGGLAYQVIAGVDIYSASQMIFTVDYRYFATDEMDFVDAVGTPFTMDYTAHTVLFGIRQNF